MVKVAARSERQEKESAAISLSFFLSLPFQWTDGKSNKERLFADFPGRRGETERVVCYAMRASEACMYVGIFTLIGSSSVVRYLRKQTGKEEKKNQSSSPENKRLSQKQRHKTGDGEILS